jgi:hypothetical protein
LRIEESKELLEALLNRTALEAAGSGLASATKMNFRRSDHNMMSEIS